MLIYVYILMGYVTSTEKIGYHENMGERVHPCCINIIEKLNKFVTTNEWLYLFLFQLALVITFY